MGKTGYTAKAKKAYKRTGAYKKKTTSLVKRNTLNPVEYFTRRSKVFAPLPTSFEFDRHLQRILFSILGILPHRKARCSLGLRLPIFASTFLIC